MPSIYLLNIVIVSSAWSISSSSNSISKFSTTETLAALFLYNLSSKASNQNGLFFSSTTTLTISVSGLGHDKALDRPWSPYYEAMTLYLYDGSTQELICSGRAPEDERNLLEDEVGRLSNFDMQQVKLYAGSDLETIINYQGRHGGAPAGHARRANGPTRSSGARANPPGHGARTREDLGGAGGGV